MRHLLSHVHQKPPIRLVNTAEQTTETAQCARILARTAPGDVIGAPPLGKIGKLGWLLAVVEKLVERDFHSPRQLLESLDRRNGVPVLDARDVTTKKPGALLDVTLRQFFCFTQQANAISNYHGGYCCKKKEVLQD